MWKLQLALFPLVAMLLLSGDNDAANEEEASDGSGETALDNIEANDDDSSDDSSSDDNSEARFTQGFQALVDRHGGSVKDAAYALFRERFRDREAKRQLRLENQRLQQQLPGKGRTVLPTKDANELQQYRALGKLMDVQSKLTEAQTLQQQLAERQRLDTIAQAAEAVGYNPKVLADVGKDLSYTVEDIEQGGKTVKVAYVVEGSGDKVSKKLLTEYASSKWAHHLPSLQGTGDTKQSARKLASQQAPNARNDQNSRQGVAGTLVSRRYATTNGKQEK